MAKKYSFAVAYWRVMELNKRWQEQNKKDLQFTLLKNMVKITEEAGELSEAVMKKIGAKAPDQDETDVDIDNNLTEEACDVVITALALLDTLGVDSDTIELVLFRKLDKWKAKLDKKDAANVAAQGL